MASSEGAEERLKNALADRYRIEREIGSGGMATVYLAEDLRHERKVALKVLKPELAAVMGGDRFVTEIRTTASLQHPHILPLFDSGEADGFLFYVMPFVEGESLRDRLNRERQLSVDEAVGIAGAVAGALDYAHRHEVVHRDIKPENILIHDGEPMVADFGIALAVSAAGGGRLTETGLSLGTPHYMSPEQASADREISSRSDIYSLGCVLYEMLTGDPPHTGPSAHAILMRILTEEPRSVAEVRKAVPPHVASAVARSLEKLPADRFESSEAFRAALADEQFRHSPHAGMRGPMAGHIPEAESSIPIGALIRDFRFLAVAGVAVLGSALWIGTMLSGSGDAEPQPVLRVSTSLQYGLGGATGARLAISPDGSRIAWLERREGVGHRLLMRRSDEVVPQEVPGGEDAQTPFFSPDGAWLGFINDDDDLVKVSVSGGQPLTIAPEAGLAGPHWSDAGIIVARGEEGIYAVPEEGGTPDLLVADPDASWVEALPGGTAVVYSQRMWAEGIFRIRVCDLRSGEVRTLVEEGTDPHYLASGHLIYGHGGQTLYAIPFDLGSLEVTGPPVPVLEPVKVYTGGATQFAVARNGTAVYVPSGYTGGRELIEMYPDGSEHRLPVEPGVLADPRYSPDGERIAYRDRGTIHVLSGLTGTNSPVSGSIPTFFPVWSADGATIFFSGTAEGTNAWDGFRVSADGSDPPELLYVRPYNNAPLGSLSDGRLLVVEVHPTRGRDILIYDLDGDSVAVTPYLTGNWDERAPSISPDGSWIAYASDESGREEVYVRSFPQVSERIQISRSGGAEPRCSPDGRTIYYREGTALVAADLGPGPGVEVVAYRTLFEGVDHYTFSASPQYDVHPNGDRFLVVRMLGGDFRVEEDLVFVVKWFRELEERLRSAGGDGG